MIAPGPRPNLEVLVADDESIARDILQVYLESCGCRVKSAVDGDHALHLLEDRTGHIGLIVVDACMPGPSARELYERIRELSPDVPLLYCSAYSLENPDLRFIAEYGLPFLPKPFSRADLLREMRKLLSPAQAAHCGVFHSLVS